MIPRSSLRPELRSELCTGVFGEHRLFIGGPLRTSTMHCLHDQHDLDDVTEVTSCCGLLPQKQAPQSRAMLPKKSLQAERDVRVRDKCKSADTRAMLKDASVQTVAVPAQVLPGVYAGGMPDAAEKILSGHLSASSFR